MSGSNPRAAAAGSAAGPGGLLAGKEEKKKAGGGVLNRLKARRQAADDSIGAAVTEQELLALDTIRPEHVLRLSRATESECPRGRALPSRRALPRLAGRRRPLAPRGVHPGSWGRSGRGSAPHPHLALGGKGFSRSWAAFPWSRPRQGPRAGPPSSAGSVW